jgi:hypothetical protein
VAVRPVFSSQAARKGVTKTIHSRRHAVRACERQHLRQIRLLRLFTAAVRACERQHLRRFKRFRRFQQHTCLFRGCEGVWQLVTIC